MTAQLKLKFRQVNEGGVCSLRQQTTHTSTFVWEYREVNFHLILLLLVVVWTRHDQSHVHLWMS